MSVESIVDLLIAPLAFRVAALGLAYLTVAVAVSLAVALIAGALLRSQKSTLPPSSLLLCPPLLHSTPYVLILMDFLKHFLIDSLRKS